MPTFALTGVTGLLGSHLLFEIIKQHLSGLEDLRILVLGRGKGRQSLRERVCDIFRKGGYSYLGQSGYDPKEIDYFLRHRLICLDCSLEDAIVLSDTDRAILQQTPIDYFFHLAALPDLRNRPETAEKVMRINYGGTQRLLALVAGCSVQEFCFVGTAFVCGKHDGSIAPNFQNPAQQFNNPYEQSKMRAEIAVREFAQQTGIRCRIFRPSIVCGRLMEQPFGYVSKFDVFYQLFGVFYRLKRMHQSSIGLDQASTRLHLRAVFAPHSSTNFVPVDYLVKLLYQICYQNAPGDSFHLVNEKNSILRDFLSAAAEEMAITGIEAVNEEPVDKTMDEEFYYQRMGGLFEAYLNTPPKFFDTRHEQPIIQAAGLHCPELHTENIQRLIRFAVQYHFGLSMKSLTNTRWLHR